MSVTDVDKERGVTVETIQHFINGALYSGESTRQAPVYDPARGEIAKEVVLGTASDVDAAVQGAQEAFFAWRSFSALRRARILDQFRSLLWSRADRLARAISAEHGKTHEDALGEVTRGIEVVEFACAAPTLLKGEFSQNVGGDVDCQAIRQPLGVCVGITPFNFPAMVPMWMFPVALAAGNTFVLKPSERDPSASLLLAQWLIEAGLPEGVFNVVHGDKEAVDALLSHDHVKAVSFVGSTPIARAVHRSASLCGKRVQALGGAKNHMIIMPDADLDMAANALMGAGFGSAGERCMAISVAVPVTDAVADALIARLVPMVKALKIGPASARGSQMGPLVSAEHLSKVRGYIDQGEAAGAKVVVDGRAFAQRLQGCENGFYLGGTLLDRVTRGMSVWEEEIFGPVLSVVRAKTYAEAMEVVGSHPFANGTALFTRDGGLARNFATEVEVGMVGINVPIPVPMAFHSFGGWKASIFADHHVHGMEGIRFYTRLKTTSLRWPSHVGTQFAMPTLG